MRDVADSSDRVLDEFDGLRLVRAGSTTAETSLKTLTAAGKSSSGSGEKHWGDERSDGNHDDWTRAREDRRTWA